MSPIFLFCPTASHAKRNPSDSQMSIGMPSGFCYTIDLTFVPACWHSDWPDMAELCASPFDYRWERWKKRRSEEKRPGDSMHYRNFRNISKLPFHFPEILLFITHPRPQEGRFAVVTFRGAGCDGRITSSDLRCGADGQVRVVLIPRRWDQADRDDRSAMEASKPGTPGRARSSR
jgi:hypothetical protein